MAGGDDHVIGHCIEQARQRNDTARQPTTLAGVERQGRGQRRDKRRERYHSAHIVPQDAAGAVVLIMGARQAGARPVGQVRAGFANRGQAVIIRGMRKTFRSAALLGALAAGLDSPGGLQAAHGYACAGEPLRIYPAAGVLPTNGELRIVFPAGSAELFVLGAGGQVMRRGEVTAKDPHFSLKSAGGKAVTLRVTQLSGPRLASFVLQLPQPLQPDTVYTLQARDIGTGDDFPIAKYQTSAAPDSSPPVLTRPATAKAARSSTAGALLVGNVRYYHLAQAGYKEAYGPWLEFSVAASDDGGPVYYEVLRTTQGTATLLATGQPERGETLLLGRFTLCHASELEFPDRGTLALSVRAVDRAGHVSAAADFAVDLSQPLRKR